MKLKKWLYALGGVGVVATPAIAVVGCSCSCSSNSTTKAASDRTVTLPQETITGNPVVKNVEYKTEAATGTLTISGDKYAAFMTEFNKLSQPSKDYLFTDSTKDLGSYPGELLSDITVANGGTKVVDEVKIENTGTELKLILKATAGADLNVIKTATTKALEDYLTSTTSSYKEAGSPSEHEIPQFETVWKLLIEAIKIA